MEYVWFVVIGLVVGLAAGQFMRGSNFGVRGDLVFGVIGALIFGIGLGSSGLAPESGPRAAAVMAALGAVLALVLRRVLRSV